MPTPDVPQAPAVVDRICSRCHRARHPDAFLTIAGEIRSTCDVCRRRGKQAVETFRSRRAGCACCGQAESLRDPVTQQPRKLIRYAGVAGGSVTSDDRLCYTCAATLTLNSDDPVQLAAVLAFAVARQQRLVGVQERLSVKRHR